MKTEDQVREDAKETLGFNETADYYSGVGQITTFSEISKHIAGDPFQSNIQKPDGWYLNKNDRNAPALIAEFKSEDKEIDNDYYVAEIQKNMRVAMTHYTNVCGILSNGNETRVFVTASQGSDEIVSFPVANTLQNHSYYEKIFTDKPVDTATIYNLTHNINDLLHFKFGITNLYDRMIFTAATLVAIRYGAKLSAEYMSYKTMKDTIVETLKRHFDGTERQGTKMQTLIDVYDSIKPNYNITSKKYLIKFIDDVNKISQSINSTHWRGEDVMGIFFNEFNRYKAKSDNGQVFTPEHITSLMYRLINIDMNDSVFDGACGSGAFLTKSMSNMIREAGGPDTNKAKEIRSHQLYGVEIDRVIWSLAASNMLLHKDGHSNIVQGDTTSPEIAEFIHDINFNKDGSLKKYHITKVLMNPPFENKYHCLDIVLNVFNNMPKGTDVALILPDYKLEKNGKTKVRKLLKHNHLLKIIKLPNETFSEGVSTSIFIFKTGEPQNDEDIFTCEIKNDGLETVKNQGRQDIKHKWQAIEDYWVKVIKHQSGDDSIKWITPDLKEMTGLSYPVPKKPFEISEEDFYRTVFNYTAFKENVDVKTMKDKLADMVLYQSDTSDDGSDISLTFKGDQNE